MLKAALGVARVAWIVAEGAAIVVAALFVTLGVVGLVVLAARAVA